MLEFLCPLFPSQTQGFLDGVTKIQVEKKIKVHPAIIVHPRFIAFYSILLQPSNTQRGLTKKRENYFFLRQRVIGQGEIVLN